jgi:hypothetical protein
MKCLGILLLVTSVGLADDPDKAKKSDSPQGAKDSYEQVVRDMLKSLSAVTKSLGEATDAESAKKVKPELEKIMQAQQELVQRIDKLGGRSKEVEDELTSKFKAELEDALKGMQVQVERLLKEPYGKDLLAVLQSKPPVKPPADKSKDK